MHTEAKRWQQEKEKKNAWESVWTNIIMQMFVRVSLWPEGRQHCGGHQKRLVILSVHMWKFYNVTPNDLPQQQQ